MDLAWTREEEYFRLTYRGLRTLENITSMMHEVKANALRTGCFRYLFDLRDTEEGFTIDDKYRLGIHLAETFDSRFTVVALLHKRQITGFLENVLVNRGLTRFRITDDESQALAMVRSL